MASLDRLPPEVLVKIFLHLPIKDIFNLSRSCKSCANIGQINLFWEQKIFKDFGIIVKNNVNNHDAKTFYQHVLYKFGHHLGLWQRTNFQYHGSLFQLVYDDWSLKLIEWFPPSYDYTRSLFNKQQ